MPLITLLRCDIKMATRNNLYWLHPLFFLLMTISLFAIAIGDLSAAAPGILWCVALLCALLSQDAVFLSDFEDGSLEQIVMSSQPLAALVFCKTIAHWLVCGLPIVVLSPLLALWLGLPLTIVLPLSLFLGTWVFSLLATFGAALNLGRKSGLLTVLVVLPLAVPVVLFAIGALQAVANGLSAAAHLSLLAAFAAFAVTVLPLLTAAALRVMISQ